MGAPLWAQPHPDPDARTMVILDSSRAMGKRIGGMAKLDIARDGLRAGLEMLTPPPQVGLTALGHRRRKDCTDVEQLMAVSELDLALLALSLRSLEAENRRRPLATALRQAVDAAPETGTLVIITAGSDTCRMDACRTATDLVRSRPALAVHVIAIGSPSPADTAALTCIAARTGGTYLTADTPAAVATALEKLVPTPPVPETGLALTATLVNGGRPVRVESLTVYAAEPETEERPQRVMTLPRVAQATAELPPGRYRVQATYGAAVAEREVEVVAGELTPLEIPLQAGRLELTAALAPGGPPLDDTTFEILAVEGDMETAPGFVGLRRATERATYVLPAGLYRVRVTHGNARRTLQTRIVPGEDRAERIALQAGRLILEAHTPAGATTPATFTIHAGTPRDDASRVALREDTATATLVLPAGRYGVTARAGELTGQAATTVAVGADVPLTIPLE
jgi:Ca-activated chloride channel family protein